MTTQVQEAASTPEMPVYEKKIRELLSNYVDGDEIFKKADEAKTWRYPVTLKEEAQGDHTLPRTWIALTERVFQILAEEKYGLDCYDNRIDLIGPTQMLESYTSNGLPAFYQHWSLGKRSVAQEKAFEQGQMGLAFEIVINSDPCLSYCMANNTPVLQMLVISHAAFGHNNFFKRNYLFRDNTEAKYIIDDMEHLGEFIQKCERKYGESEVEELLDACHALQTHAVTHHIKRDPLSPEEKKKRADAILEERLRLPTSKLDFGGSAAKKEGQQPEGKKRFVGDIHEENLLLYIANNAPEMHLPEWKREIMRQMAHVSQYFFPQGQTKMMNEGWASFWHYTMMHDMDDMGFMSESMMLEFYDNHAAVIRQPEFDEKIKLRNRKTGEVFEKPIYNGLNPYRVGIEMFMDIKRICEEPTDEDREWFPDIAGKGEWLDTLKFAMENFNDSSFALQYLSPKLMRDLKLFSLEQNMDERMITVTSIHDKDGFRDLRRAVADHYDRSNKMPHIEVNEYHFRTDRHLVLRHNKQDNRPINEADMQEVLKHIYALWEHPIVLETINEDSGEMEEPMFCPPGYADEYNYDKQQYAL